MCDWSSDVWSSDLPEQGRGEIGVQGAFDPDHRDGAAAEADTDDRQRGANAEAPRHEAETEAGHPRPEREGIGTAPCRARAWQSVSISVVASSLKTTKYNEQIEESLP